MPKHIPQPTSIEELDAALESRALKRVLVSQANGKLYLCGQCCVAMVADTTLQEAIIATEQLGATMPQDLVRGLRVFQISYKQNRFNPDKLPERCLIHVLRAEESHWVYRFYDFIYNPMNKEPTPIGAEDLSGAHSIIELR